jgi:transcriptional regulator with XRE-family HTH domain
LPEVPFARMDAEKHRAGALAQRLKHARAAKRMTQGQLAIAAQVERTTISNYETGRVANPSAFDLERIARALGVTVEYLITGREPDVTQLSAERLLREFERWLRTRGLGDQPDRH